MRSLLLKAASFTRLRFDPRFLSGGLFVHVSCVRLCILSSLQPPSHLEGRTAWIRRSFPAFPSFPLPSSRTPTFVSAHCVPDDRVGNVLVRVAVVDWRKRRRRVATGIKVSDGGVLGAGLFVLLFAAAADSVPTPVARIHWDSKAISGQVD